jgi:hypothetical protein
MSKGRALALAAHAVHDGSGLTDFELASLTKTSQTSIGKRRKELCEAGLIVGTTERRPSPSGSPSIVWQITPMGAEIARSIR